MSDTALTRLRAGIIALAPLVLLVGFVWHPYVGDLSDPAAVAAAVEEGAARWAGSHLFLAVGMGLAVLAVFSLRLHLLSAGERLWSLVAVPLVTLGAALVVFVIGVEGTASTAVARSGGSVEAFLTEAETWTLPAYLAGAALLALGLLALARALVVAAVMERSWTWISVTALIVLAAVSFVPLGWSMVASGVAAVVAFWPIAYRMWVGGAPAQAPVTGPQPSTA